MPRTLAPDEARAEAKRLRADADDVERTARAEAAGLRFMAGELEDAADRGLTINADRAIVQRKMQPQPTMRAPRKVGRPVSVKHRFRSWLDGQGLNVKEWAEAHHRPQSTVRSWMRALSDGGRKIPEGDALMIQNEAGRDDAGRWVLPATTATWPNGIAP